jgi:hypothetical protein
MSFLQIGIYLFAGAIGIACIWGFLVPARLTGLVRKFWDRKPSLTVAVVARLVLGAMLISVAPESRFPVVFQVIGGLAIFAAILLPIIGKERIGRLIAWLDEMPDALTRVWLIFGLAFSLFLIYGARN